MGGIRGVLGNYRARELRLPDDATWERCLTTLRGVFRVDVNAPRSIVRTFYDTFDWRLFRAGHLLTGERYGRRGGRRLVWLDTRSGAHLSLAVDAAPSDAASLPEPLGRRLAALIEPRELCAVCELRGPIISVSVLDDQGKTLARLEKGAPQVWIGRRRRGALETRVVLTPLRGYPRATARVAAVLQASGAEESELDMLGAALAKADRAPGDYSPKLEVPLDTGQTAQQATVAVLRHLARVMQWNEAGTVAGADPEYLHDFRVAIRRTRALLAQSAGLFADDALQPFRDEFRWLAGETSDARDLDVQCLEFAATQDQRLAPLVRYLRRQRDTARADLKRALAGTRYRNLMHRWSTFLDAATDGKGAQAEAPAREFASRRIYRLYRRVLRDGRSVNATSGDEALHDLRKTCKKLRYVMEAYQNLYPKRRMARRIKDLRRLQDYLGTFQDQSVQQQNLRRIGRALAAQNGNDVEVLMEIGQLVERLRTAQHATRAEFADRFAGFTAHHGAFKKLFKT